MSEEKLVKMLASIPNAREDIIQELHDMAAAKGHYFPLGLLPLWMRDIWLIAAEILERDSSAETVH